MKNFNRSLLLASLLVSPISAVWADTLVLKDGQTLSGNLVSRNANGVVFEVAGQQMKFDASSVQSISFDDAAPAAATTPAVNPAAAPAPRPVPTAPADAIPLQLKPAAEPTSSVAPTAKVQQAVEVPAGTRLVVRTSEAINSKQHKTGHKFTARLEADLVVDNIVVATRGSMLYGQITEAKQSGRLAGSSSLLFTFTDIMIDSQMKPIVTSDAKAVTSGTGGKTAGTTARAAALGGLINGSKGARDGAKVGLGASILTSGNSVSIASGTLLEFNLQQPLKL